MSGLSLSNVQLSPNYAGSILKDSGVDYMQLAKGLQMGMELREKHEQYALARAQRELEMQQMQAISGIGSASEGGGDGAPVGGLRGVMGSISQKTGGGGRGGSGGGRGGATPGSGRNGIIGDRGQYELSQDDINKQVMSAGGLGGTDSGWSGSQLQGRNADARTRLTQAAMQVQSLPAEQREGAYNSISAELINDGVVQEGQVPAWNNGGAGLVSMIIKQNEGAMGDSRNPGVRLSNGQRGTAANTNYGAIQQARADGYQPYDDSFLPRPIVGLDKGGNAIYGDLPKPLDLGGDTPIDPNSTDLEDYAATQYGVPQRGKSNVKKTAADTQLDNITFENPYDPMMGRGNPLAQGAGAVAMPESNPMPGQAGPATPVGDQINQMNTLSAAQQLGFISPSQMMQQYGNTPDLQAPAMPGQVAPSAQGLPMPAGSVPASQIPATQSTLAAAVAPPAAPDAGAPMASGSAVQPAAPDAAAPAPDVAAQAPLAQQSVVDQQERAQYRQQMAQMDYQVNSLKRNVDKAKLLNKRGRVSDQELSSWQVQLDAANDAQKQYVEDHKQALIDRRDAIKEAQLAARQDRNEARSDARADRREQREIDRQAKKDAEKDKEPEIGAKVDNLKGNVAQQAEIMYGGAKGSADMMELYTKLGNPNLGADIAAIDTLGIGKLANAVQSPDQQKYNYLRQDLTDRIARLRTGAAFTESEAKRFERFIPARGDNNETARYKLSLLQDSFNRAYNNLTHRREDAALTNTVSQGGEGYNAARSQYPGLSRDQYDKLIQGAK